MSSLLIRGMPADLHERLRSRAGRNHRSMAREAISLLEEVLGNETMVREAPSSYSDGPGSERGPADIEEERSFMRAVVAGLADIEAGRETSLAGARQRLGVD